MKGRKGMRLIIAVFAVAAMASLAYAFSNVRKGYEPRQPIAFSHKRMAGEPLWVTNDKGDKVNAGGFGIPCMYCHTMPFKGRHATLPSTAVCMNCHTNVGLDKEWVLKMKDYWDRGEPIPWVRVHDLPDFVYFDHSAHLNAKDANGAFKLASFDPQGKPIAACATCHGRVDQMEMVSVQTTFNMQWCLDCHRKPAISAPTDCITCHR
jgi:menaquinone reductase, multiheme cytochrome c subunit